MRDICRSELGSWCCSGDVECLLTLDNSDAEDDDIYPTTAVPAVAVGKQHFEAIKNIWPFNVTICEKKSVTEFLVKNHNL